MKKSNVFTLLAIFFALGTSANAEIIHHCLIDSQSDVGNKMFGIELKQTEENILIATHEEETYTASAEINLKLGAHVLKIDNKETETGVQSGGGFNDYGFLGVIHRGKGKAIGLYCFQDDQSRIQWMKSRK